MNRLLLLLLIVHCSLSIAVAQVKYNVSGKITYDNSINSSIKFSQVNLKDSSNNIINTFFTDSLGNYLFTDVPNGNYSIEIIPGYYWGGVNPVDALQINRNYIRLYNFKDLLKKKAADINSDLKTNPIDALLVNRRYIKIINSFKAGDWLMDNNIVNVTGQDITKNIKLICTGDVDGSYIPITQHRNCGGPLIDSRDGQVYSTVQIGTQCWMQENLKAAKYNDGTSIPLVTDNTEWVNLTTPAFCIYNYDAGNSATYGNLYNWYTANDNHKLCPSGWHLPADSEWTKLTDYLGGDSIAGGKLKEAGTKHWLSPNAGATNESGFLALPGGFRNGYYTGSFSYIDNFCYWWSATLTNDNYAWGRYLIYSDAIVNRSTYYKTDGFSVRCLKD